MRIAVLVLALAATLMGCASSSLPAVKPAVLVTQTSKVDLIHAAPASEVPVELNLKITNPLDRPVTLLSVEIESVGRAGGYAMKHVKHAFSQPIPANGTHDLPIRVWVEPLQQSTSGRVVASVLLRGIARFEWDGKVIRSNFTNEVQQ